MILVTMGTQALQCERIINAIMDAKIDEEIIIQSYYENVTNRKIPKNVKIIDFVPYNEMQDLYERADIIVASGTGSIFRALHLGKKTIIFPRLGRYKEAADDHTLDMKVLETSGYALFVDDEKDFKKIYEKCKKNKLKRFVSNSKAFSDALENELHKL